MYWFSHQITWTLTKTKQTDYKDNQKFPKDNIGTGRNLEESHLWEKFLKGITIKMVRKRRRLCIVNILEHEKFLTMKDGTLE